MEQKSEFKVNLTETEGDGEFPCPSCGSTISPDDESGVAYDIIGVKTKEDGSLEEVIVICKKCGCIIHLDGFEKLSEIDSDQLFSLDDYLLRPQKIILPANTYES